MAGDDVSVESVEIALLSEIGMSSAIEMKNAYLQPPGEIRDGERYVPYREPITSPEKEQLTGPNALVYVTKIATRISGKEIEHLLKDDAGGNKITGNPVFYAVVLTMSMRLGDPSTTRFINGIVDVSLPEEVTILNYSPKERGIITAVIESGGNTISLSRDPGFPDTCSPGHKNPVRSRGIPVRDNGWPGRNTIRHVQQKNRLFFHHPCRCFTGIPGNAQKRS